jgi:adenylate cyclase
VQSLVENGSLEGAKGAYRLVAAAETLELPSTVQSVLAARLDRLPERDKRLLQTASVIGKEFSGVLLERVVATSGRHVLSDPELAEAVDALARAEFIFEAALYPEVEYAFKHPLTQEVAYESQLATRRAELHGAVARAIEQLDAEKLDERAALLGYHWEQAGEAVTAAQWHSRAAAAAGFDSPVEALRHWEKVWEILQSERSGEDAVRLRIRAASELLNLGWRLGMTPERVALIFDEGKALAVERGDLREQVRLHYALGLRYATSGNSSKAIPVFEESLDLADASGDPELRWSAREGFEWALWQIGELEAALRMNDEQMVLREVDACFGVDIVGFSTSNSFSHRGMMLGDLGRFHESAEAFRRCDELARRLGENEQVSWNEFFWAFMLLDAGDVRAALSMARRGIESSERIGSAVGRAGAHGSYGMALVLDSEWQAARESLELAVELIRAGGSGRFCEPQFLAALAEARLGLGDALRARELSEEAIETAVQTRIRVAEVRARLSLARVLLALDGVDAQAEVGSTLDRALAIVRSTWACAQEPLIYVEMARLAALRSDSVGRERWLREARRLFTEMAATGHAERVAKTLGPGEH